MRIEFDIPKDKVLLSDFDAWHCVLNKRFLSLTEDEDNAFAAELQRAEAQDRWPYSESFRSRVVSSWQRIFDLEVGEEGWWGAPSERSIQATFWQLELPQVRHVDKFIAR